MKTRWTQAVWTFFALMVGALGVRGKPPSEDEMAKVRAALPDSPIVRPAVPRKVLIFTLTKGFRHDSIELCTFAFTELGKKTGAFTAEDTDDPGIFMPERLANYDAIVFNNTTGTLFDEPERKDALLKYVRGGRGIVGVHAATDCFYKWPEFGELMGGYFDGHPWNEKVYLKLDEPEHPLVVMLKELPELAVADEIYQFKDPYSRSKLRVLVSLDTTRTNMKKDKIKRTDGDFAVSWVRPYGQGRVFYCSLGHRREIFWAAPILRHYLAGIQFACGDLKAPMEPQPAGR